MVTARIFLIGAACLLGGFACNSETPEAPEGESPTVKPILEPPVVEVTALDFNFETPDTLPAGWVTVRMQNAGAQEHFLSLYRLPPNKDFVAYTDEVLDVFGSLWAAYVAGEATREETWSRFFEDIPAWFWEDIVYVGGPALTEPGELAEVTVHLEPGSYVMECYVKTPEGKYHTELGMMRPVTVAGPESNASPPAPDVMLTLRNYAVEVDGKFVAGPQIVAVTVADTPDGFAKHDINLFRLGEGDDLQAIVEWMDWMDFGQFRAPAPAYSLGGMDSQVEGRTGYVHLDLEPGRYAWVSEEYGARGVVHAFTVK